MIENVEINKHKNTFNKDKGFILNEEYMDSSNKKV